MHLILEKVESLKGLKPFQGLGDQHPQFYPFLYAPGNYPNQSQPLSG